MIKLSIVSPPELGRRIWGSETREVDWQHNTILLMFFNIGCAGCTGRALPFARDILQDFPDLTLLGVHITPHPNAAFTPEQVRAVAEYYHLPYPLYFDETNASLRDFPIGGTPHWVLLRKGRVRHSIYGSMPGSLQCLDLALQEAFGVVHIPPASVQRHY